MKLSTSDIRLSTYADLIISGENPYWNGIYITQYSCSAVSMCNCQMEIRVQLFTEACYSLKDIILGVYVTAKVPYCISTSLK